MMIFSGFLENDFCPPNWAVLRCKIKLLILIIFQGQFYIKYFPLTSQNNGTELCYLQYTGEYFLKTNPSGG